MTTTKRRNEVDIIRMASLIGICVVNIPFLALPVESVIIPPDGFLDRSAAFLVECFFQLKFFILFSFIFGWGMAVQARSAKSKGQSFARRYFQRMFGLALLGVAHAVFVFSGDILLLYALLGSLLWLIKDWSPRRLMKMAAWMVLVSLMSLTLLAALIDAMLPDDAGLFAATDGPSLGGGFFEATQARMMDWPVTFAFLLLLQGPLAFGAFAAGLAAAKTDFFSENSDGMNQLQQRVPLLLVIALPLNLLYAGVMGGIVPESYEILSLLGFALIAIGAPALSTVYLYLFIRLSRKIKVPHLLVLAGQNSLSSYVAQGVFGGLVFGTYGLGLFGSLGHGALLPLSVAIAFASMVFVGIFANIFGRGPLEPILRRISGHGV